MLTFALCPYFPLDSSGHQHGNRGDVPCNQSPDDNHARAEDSLLSSRQCWVWSLLLHYGVCYNPWPPVASEFFRSPRKQGCRWPKAATIKSHMRIHLNAGNNIETPVQMRDAVLSCGGVPTINVARWGMFSLRRVVYGSGGCINSAMESKFHGKQSGVFHPYLSFRPLTEFLSV